MPLLILSLGVLVVGLLLSVFFARPQRVQATTPELAAATHLRRSRILAFVAGLIAFVASAVRFGGLGRGFTIAPAVAGAVTICLLAFAERTVPVAAAQQRRAELAPRSPWASVSSTVRTLSAVMLAVLVGIMVLGWVTGGADGTGHAGRAVVWSTAEGSQGGSPWPGSFYDVPVAVALLVALLCFARSLRWVAERPQLNADAQAAVRDGEMRVRSCAVLQAVLLATLATTLGGFALMTFAATSGALAGSPAWVAIAHWGAFLGALLALVGLGAALRQLVRR